MPLAIVSGTRKMVKRKSVFEYALDDSGLDYYGALKQFWLDGAPLGLHCKCKNKIVVERGQYSDEPAESVFKAWVEYCPKHGFTTDCWVCGDGTTTEVCNRDHKAHEPLS